MRTDQRTYCPACRLRFSPREECPGCGTRALYDLSDPDRRDLALRATRNHQRGRRPRDDDEAALPSWESRAFVAALLYPVFALGVAASGLFPLGVAFAAAIAPTLATVALLSRRRPREHLSADSVDAFPHDVGILPSSMIQPGALPAADRVTVQGVVRALRTMPSPLHGRPCVAFRLQGTGVDDGGCVSFDVELEGHWPGDPGIRWAHVDAHAASVELEIDDRPRLHPTSAPLRSFLEARFVFRSPSSIPLAEAILADGDPVELEGMATRRPEPAGYRGTTWRPVFRDAPGAPLIVRRGRSCQTD